MDDPDISDEELTRALVEIEVINRALGGYSATLGGIESLVPRDAPSFTVLDVGAGAGDAAKQMVRWAARQKKRIHVTSVDLAPATAAYAQRQTKGMGPIEVVCADLFELPESETFDIVHAQAVLHHFPGVEAQRALKKMFALARLGVVVNDLHRHPAAWLGIRMLTMILSRSRLVRNDGPLSVLRAFRRSDWSDLAAEAGLPSPEVAWRALFRWQVVLRKPAVVRGMKAS